MKRLFFLSVLICCATAFGCGQGPSDASAHAEGAKQTPSNGTKSKSGAPAKAEVSYDQLLADAETALKGGKAQQALLRFRQAVAAHPERPEAYIRRAKLLADSRLFSQAVNDMSAAINIVPDDPRLHNSRGYFLLLDQQYDRAERDFSDAIGLDLNYPQPYNNRGLVWIAKNQFGYAVKDFDNAIQIDAEYTDAHNNRGFALYQLGKTEEAISSFSKALELDPDYINSLTNRGRAYQKSGQHKLAIIDFTHAIELQPENLQHLAHRSESYRALGQDKQAQADLDLIAWTRKLDELNRRIAQNTRDVDAWAQRGNHLIERQRLDEAEKSLTNALALDEQHQLALIGRARLHMLQEDFAAAVEDCTQALKTGNSYEAHSLRGDAHVKLSHFDQAIEDYQAARRFDADVVSVYRLRAKHLRSEGKDDQAKADEVFAKEMETRLTSAHVPAKRQTPRAMVVEQVSHEEPAQSSK